MLNICFASPNSTSLARYLENMLFARVTLVYPSRLTVGGKFQLFDGEGYNYRYGSGFNSRPIINSFDQGTFHLTQVSLTLLVEILAEKLRQTFLPYLSVTGAASRPNCAKLA